jgi:hypothetical protein
MFRSLFHYRLAFSNPKKKSRRLFHKQPKTHGHYVFESPQNKKPQIGALFIKTTLAASVQSLMQRRQTFNLEAAQSWKNFPPEDLPTENKNRIVTEFPTNVNEHYQKARESELRKRNALNSPTTFLGDQAQSVSIPEAITEAGFR